MESEESNVEGQKHLRMVHYYYINYKQFVNVVKYRLDQMRRKLEMDEKKVRVCGVMWFTTNVTQTASVCVAQESYIAYNITTSALALSNNTLDFDEKA